MAICWEVDRTCDTVIKERRSDIAKERVLEVARLTQEADPSASAVVVSRPGDTDEAIGGSLRAPWRERRKRRAGGAASCEDV